ncbi:Putative agmatinase 1 [Vanrija pseudolonga]|uniref:Agmatinase 1 n=1 Tax=Vanrija pseudolonga TaxID=143232 RepID=A0AAF1BEW3_9TREE|nr:Putative agmatinase 1 [Vanrija pseudolonga]
MLLTPLIALLAALPALAEQAVLAQEPWQAKYGGTPDLTFSGVAGFGRLPHAVCLDEPGRGFDVAVLGMPFDTTVSYRPGARFGPHGIRTGSRRIGPARSFIYGWGFSPAQDSGLDIIDCNDVPVSPYDPALAIDEMQVAYQTLLARPVSTPDAKFTRHLAKDGKEHPRLLTLGGDHTIVLPILGALSEVYGPITVLHFDAHLDTWNGHELGGAHTEQHKVTHGTFFWKAHELGYINNATSAHAGIRTRLSSMADLLHDEAVGFRVFSTDDIDELGADGVASALKKRLGNGPVYLSFDIDTIDPSMAPATGTPESGGWTTREVKRIVRGLHGLNIVGADIVEVSPAYDTNAELTTMAAADLAMEFLALMTSKDGPIPASKKGVLNPELKAKLAKAEAAKAAARDEL